MSVEDDEPTRNSQHHVTSDLWLKAPRQGRFSRQPVSILAKQIRCFYLVSLLLEAACLGEGFPSIHVLFIYLALSTILYASSQHDLSGKILVGRLLLVPTLHAVNSY